MCKEDELQDALTPAEMLQLRITFQNHRETVSVLEAGLVRLFPIESASSPLQSDSKLGAMFPKDVLLLALCMLFSFGADEAPFSVLVGLKYTPGKN